MRTCKAYDKALRDESLDLRVPVKNLMENLRSALDYMAHDVYESCCPTARLASGRPEPRNIYFPVGRSEADFRSGVGSLFAGLDTLDPSVYNLIASIQPFQSGDNWPYDLCSILNEKTHDRFTPPNKLTHKRGKWVAFLFEGTNVNVLGLLDKAVPGISDFAEALYREI